VQVFTHKYYDQQVQETIDGARHDENKISVGTMTRRYDILVPQVIDWGA